MHQQDKQQPEQLNDENPVEVMASARGPRGHARKFTHMRWIAGLRSVEMRYRYDRGRDRDSEIKIERDVRANEKTRERERAR